jgi:O-antigen ligase
MAQDKLFSHRSFAPGDWLLVFLPLLFYSVQGGYGVAYGLLVIFAMSRILFLGYSYSPGSLGALSGWKEVLKTPFTAAIAIYCGVCISIDLAHQEPINAYERYLVWILAPIVLIGLRGMTLKPEAFFIGGALAALIGCGRALYMVFVEDAFRPAPGANNPIFFGNTSLLLALLCLSGLLYASQGRHGSYRLLLFLGVLAGLYASFLSGSKGGWIAFPLLLFVLGTPYFRKHSDKKLSAAAIILVSISILSYAPGSPVSQMLNEATIGVSQYAKTFRKPPTERSVDGSVGARIEQYIFASYAARNQPFFGRSQENLLQLRGELISQGKLHPYIGNPKYISSHNEIVDHFLQRGYIGLIVLIVFYVLIIRSFVNFRSSGGAIVALKLFGISTGLALIVFGLTNPHLLYSGSRSALAFLITITIAVIVSNNRPYKAVAEPHAVG